MRHRRRARNRAPGGHRSKEQVRRAGASGSRWILAARGAHAGRTDGRSAPRRNSCQIRDQKTLQSLLRSFGHESGMSSAWGRIFHLYGPHEHPSRLVSSVIRSLLRGEPVPCSDGRQVLDFLHVADVASAFVALLESNVEGPVNIASGVPVTVRRVVETIAQKIARPDLVRFGARPATPGPSRLVASVRRLDREVGWKPHYALDKGLDQIIEW